MRNILIFLFSFTLTLQLSACSGPETPPPDETLRVGILPDESVTALRQRYVPLLDFLSNETGLHYELVIPGSYEELVKLFGEGRVNVAYFGGVTFVKANHEHDAVPIAMRDVDTRFTSVIVVADEDIENLESLKGKRFSFGSRLSTSGHMMPRYFMQQRHSVSPEHFFHSVRYSGKHDRTAYWVRDGEVDAGVLNSEILRKMHADGRLRPGDIRIIWTTPPYTDYVWAVHPRIRPAIREKIQLAFLQLAGDDPQHNAILSNLGSSGFYPASVEDFSSLKQILMKQGVL